MQDRIPLYPGRVKLTPVSGQENTYDMVRADSPTQEGTALSKANLLKDTTAALYGLDETATPDEVLAWLGKYAEYWWELYHDTTERGYTEIKTVISDAVNFLEDSTQTIYYSSSIAIDQSNGTISLISPLTATVETAVAAGFNTLISAAPCYITGLLGTDDVYYLPEGATVGGGVGYTINYGSKLPKSKPVLNGSSSTGAPDEAKVARIVTSKAYAIESGYVSYEHSTDRGAYPDSGTVDDITFFYLGIPYENFSAKRADIKGNYIGTGTVGSSAPNTLTLPFRPRKVILIGPSGFGIVAPDSTRSYLQTTLMGNSGVNVVSYDESTHTLSWYARSGGTVNGTSSGVVPAQQYNESCVIYDYYVFM